MAHWSVATGNRGTLTLHVNLFSQDIVNNTSVIDVIVELSCTDTATFFNTPKGVYVSGIGAALSASFTWAKGGGSRYILHARPTVGHNADGSLTLNVAASMDATGTWGLGGPAYIGTQSFVVPTIPRASTPTFSTGSVNAGSPVTINTNRASTGFTHTVRYQFGSASGVISTGVGASVAWTPPVSLLSQIPNTTSASATITLETYSGSTHIGTKTASLTIAAGSDVVPNFTTVTHSEAVPLVASTVGAYTQRLSKLNLAITGATGVHGSSITSYRITVDGQQINTVSGQTAELRSSGTLAIVGTVTDSRGRSTSKTVNIPVIAYDLPRITSWSAQRALAGGQPNNDGTYIRIDLNAAVQSLVVGTQKNQLRYRVRTAPRGTGTWTSRADVTLPLGTLAAPSVITVGTFPVSSSFDVEVVIFDKFRETEVRSTVGTSAVLMHYGETGVGFGKYHSQGALDISGPVYIGDSLAVTQTVLDAFVPAGIIHAYAGETAPSGFLLCHGQAVSRTEYPRLFSAIGTTYGTGNGSSTFNLPDLRGRSPLGKNPADSDFNGLNLTGGHKRITLNVTHLPPHTHQTWARDWEVARQPGSGVGASVVGQPLQPTGSTGSGAAHDNMHPYQTVNFIIKT